MVVRTIKEIYNLDDTIAAISTAPGEGAIGIVRLSGKEALKIAAKVFVSKDGQKVACFKDKTMHYGWIVDRIQKAEAICVPARQGRAGTSREGQVRQKKNLSSGSVIDEVLLTVMRAPATYTRQDIVEINCHSGIWALKKVLELVLDKGARLAEAGEFTKRAFLKGRIDLVQAEAVLDVIKAKTEVGLEAAVGQLRGRLSKEIDKIRNVLVGILANFEASFDFSQEEIEVLNVGDIDSGLKAVKDDLLSLIESAESGRIIRDGIMTVICGKPNVGKSSLMNAFLREDKVIVTPIAGTTRDVIEDIINIEGIPLKVVDTAGIIEPRDLVEKEGVARSKKCLNEADLILFVLDNSRPLSTEDFQIIDNIKKKAVIVVINKMDLKPKIDLKSIRDFLKGKRVVNICAIKEKGIPALEDGIKEHIMQGRAVVNGEGVLVTNLRHKRKLEECLRCIDVAIGNLKNGKGEELIAEDIKEALKPVGHIIGEVTPDEILDRIFEDFCIGK